MIYHQETFYGATLWFECLCVKLLHPVAATSRANSVMMMMMIAPNSRARKGGKEKGKVKGEYGGMMMRIAPNSCARKGGKKKVEGKGEFGII